MGLLLFKIFIMKTNYFSDFLNKNQKDLIKDLSSFIEIKSIANNYSEIKKIVKLIILRLKKLGFKVKIDVLNNSNPFIIAEFGSGKKSLLIYDHYDVMSADPINEWKYNPFKLTQEKEFLYGRGLADNKGHLILRLQAIETIFKLLKRIPIKIKWIIEGEEEIGSPHIKDLSNKYQDFLKKNDLCLWESGDVDEKGNPHMFLGMKGIAYFLLTCEVGKNDLHSGFASLVDSAVWRLIHALKTIRDDKGNILIPEILKKIKPPNNYYLKLIKKYPLNKKKLLEQLGKNYFLKNEKSKEKILLNHFFGITCNICGISAGSTKKNEIKTILPHKAYAKIDFRLVENVDCKKISKIISRHFKKNGYKDIKIKELITEPVAITNYKNKYFKKALKIIERSFCKKIILSPYAKGSGPMYYVASKFKVPCIQLGAQNPASNIHGPNENIKIEDYFKAMQATIDLIMNLE